MKKKEIFTEYLWMTVGVVLVTAGVYFFKFPNNFSIGGVTGTAILLQQLTNGALSSATIVLILNMLLMVIGIVVLGKDFGIKTVYGTLLMSGLLQLLEFVYPMKAPFTDEPLLELFFAVILPGTGAAILFNHGGSTGGTDVVAMIFRKYTSIDIGKSLLCVDLVLTLAVFPVFGIKTGLLALTGLIIKTLVIDNLIESMNLCKYFTIVCTDPKPVCDYITHTLKRSATIVDGQGAFTEHSVKLVLTVMPRAQAMHLRKFIKETEPGAFIMITNTSEIIGRGFRA